MNKQDLYNLIYYYDNGILYYRANKKRAGSTRKDKYITIKKNDIKDYVHRIIYIMFYGDILENHDIHHIDGDRSNNRIENLESVSRLRHNFKKDKFSVTYKHGNWQITTQYNYNNYRFYNIDKDELLKVYESFCESIINNVSLDSYEDYIVSSRKKRIKLIADQEYLLKNYHYRDGNLFKISTGKKIGHIHSSGYIHANIRGFQKGLHRWIYIYHHGNVPENMVIDHIDSNKLNNKVENLRYASLNLNSINTIRKRKPSEHHKGGWQVVTKRSDRIYRKYFGRNKYKEAVQFCLALDEIREDEDKIKELYNLII